jgi:hypothetical protein
MTKSAKSAALERFGLRDVGILYSRAIIQRKTDVSPSFWSMVQRKRPHANLDPSNKEVGIIFA